MARLCPAVAPAAWFPDTALKGSFHSEGPSKHPLLPGTPPALPPTSWHLLSQPRTLDQKSPSGRRYKHVLCAKLGASGPGIQRLRAAICTGLGMYPRAMLTLQTAQGQTSAYRGYALRAQEARCWRPGSNISTSGNFSCNLFCFLVCKSKQT